MLAIARCYFAACALAIIGMTPAAVRAASETVVYSFKGGIDGANPQTSLTKLGNTLYGTTFYGGTGKNCYPYPGYCGTAFSLTLDGTETVIYSFGVQNDADAAFPHGRLIKVDGTLYGTAFGGIGYPVHIGDGTIFHLTPNGTETVLYDFNGDNVGPIGITKVGRNFYGALQDAGTNENGAVFSMTPSGVLSLIYVFQGNETGENDGAYPSSTLIHVGEKFYGITSVGGGPGCNGQSCGTFFSVTTAGLEKIVYTFGLTTGDGANPKGDLIYLDGKFYGTTIKGGGTGCGGSGCGTIFSITPDGTGTVLYAFKGGNDGATPQGCLLEVGDKLYGTTSAGGKYGYGTIFRVSSSGAEKVLHAFGASNDGKAPSAGLTKFGGALYGTTYSGGANGVGTVFKIVP